MPLTRKPLVSWRPWGLAALFLVLVTGAVVLAVSRPLCCADDAAHAVLAKNLAFGYGYANTLGHNTYTFAFRRFDPVIGTGPTIIVPAALGIWLFGNEASVPGLSAIVLWAGLCVLLYRAVARTTSTDRAVPTAACFLVVCFVVSPYSAFQWFALLGEVPATLLVLLCAVTLATDKPSAGKAWLAGLFLGFAVAAKLLTVIYAFPALAFVALRPAGSRRARMVGVGAFIAGLMLPTCAFETWKFASLRGAYLDALSNMLQFVRATGLAQEEQPLAVRVAVRLHDYRERFGVPLPLVALTAALSGWIVMRRGEHLARRIVLLLSGFAVLHLGYWLVASNGNPRYAFPATMLLAALISARYLAKPSRVAGLAFALALAGVIAPPLDRVPFYGSFYTSDVMGSSDSAAEETADFLLAHRGRGIVLTQWWGTAAALEYASAQAWIFDGYNVYASRVPGSGALIAYSVDFLDTTDKQFGDLVAACGPPVFSSGPYRVHQCAGPSGVAATKG